MIDTSDLEQAKIKIRKSNGKIVVRAQNQIFNRKIISYGRFHILLFPSNVSKKRSLKYIESGLDYISAKEATKKGIIIGIDIKEISGLPINKKASAIESLIQNIKILRKAKTKIKLLNYKNRLDAMNFLTSLGASSQQAKESVNSKSF